MHTSGKTVSVVMATHNGAKFVSEQVQSILNQTLQPIQFIISDDCSKDETVSIVEDMVRGSDIDVQIIRNIPAYGFRDNFIRAAMKARGDFIAFCDQDDIWDRRKLERCSAYFQDPSVSLIVHRADIIDEQSNKTGTFPQGIARTAIKRPLSYDPWLTFFGFSMVFRRELLNIADNVSRFVDFIEPTQRVAHDRWVIFLAQMVGSTVEINESLVGYRQHESNVFGDGSRRRDNNNSNLLRRSRDYISATADMIEIVRKMPDWTREKFPQYDRDRALAFLGKALRQLQDRNHIYDAGTTVEAVRNLLSCMRGVGYRSVHNNKFRWRSLARDVRFLLSPEQKRASDF